MLMEKENPALETAGSHMLAIQPAAPGLRAKETESRNRGAPRMTDIQVVKLRFLMDVS